MSRTHKVGPFRVRPHIRNGAETGRHFLDIPASISGTGRRVRKLFDSRTTALAVARELKRRLELEGLLPKVGRPRSGLPFREAAERWAEDEELRVATLKKRSSTLETDRQRLKPLVAFLGQLDVAAIGKRELLAYQKWRLEQGRSPCTVNSELGTFGLVMRWAVEHGYRRERPKVEQIPAPPRRVVIPTPEEVARVVAALPERLKPLIWFLAETGCRKGEAFHLTWDAVDEVNGVVEIRARHGWTPKTRQSEREIPLSLELLAALRRLPKRGSYVFPGRAPGKPMDNFRKALAAAVTKADLRRNGRPVHLTLQSFRKAYATWQAMRGVHERVLQALLGHAAGSRVTNQYYVQATEAAKRAAVIQLPLGERMANAARPKLATSGNNGAAAAETEIPGKEKPLDFSRGCRGGRGWD